MLRVYESLSSALPSQTTFFCVSDASSLYPHYLVPSETMKLYLADDIYDFQSQIWDNPSPLIVEVLSLTLAFEEVIFRAEMRRGLEFIFFVHYPRQSCTLIKTHKSLLMEYEI